MTTEIFQAMAQSIIDGDAEVAEKLAQQAIEQGIDPLEAINKGFVVGVNHVGNEFSCGNAFLPELVMAGEAMKAAVSTLEPEMNRRGTSRDVLGKVVLATIQGDIHDIGKTLVGTMLSAAGFQVYDLGVDVPVMKLVEKAREVDAEYYRCQRSAHHDHGAPTGRSRGAGGHGAAIQDQGDGGRRASDQRVGQGNRGGWLQRRRHRCGFSCQEIGRKVEADCYGAPISNL